MAGREDWRPYHEIDDVLEHLRWLVFRRWSRQSARDAEVAKDVQDALMDLRLIVREAHGTWRRLGRYRPGKEEEE